MNELLNYMGLPPFELALFFGSVLIMTVVGIAMIHWVKVEGYLLRKGWVPWLNNREERENEKLDQYLKGYYERQKERENDC